MNAVIVGCGKVGEELARTLVNDGHNVSVIDNQQKSLDEITDDLDVMAILGNGADIETLNEAGLKDADIFISVTTSDELNLLSCLMAKEEAKCETIARVRNPLYSREVEYFKEKLGISKIINPEYLAAVEIFHLLQFPALSRIDFFEDGNVIISSMRVGKEFRYIGQSLEQITRENKDIKTLVCAASRNGENIIPKGNFVIREGDDITVVATKADIKRFLKNAGVKNVPAESVLIVGASTLSFYLVKLLTENGKRVRVIDNDMKKCDFFSEHFSDAEIIYGDGTDRRFLAKQGLIRADAFIPLTGIDEENLVTATYAKGYSGSKVITKISRTDMSDLIRTLNIDSVVFPKLLCADIIAQYVRTKEADTGSNLAKLYRYLNDAFEIAEFKAGEDPDITGIPVKNLRLKKNLIIAGIISKGVYTIPSGDSVIKENDYVIIVTAEKGFTSLRDILA